MKRPADELRTDSGFLGVPWWLEVICWLIVLPFAVVTWLAVLIVFIVALPFTDDHGMLEWLRPRGKRR